MEEFISAVYVPLTGGYSQDPLMRELNTHIKIQIEDAVRNGVKVLVIEVVEELIDKLYTADDFEKDIGLL